MNVEKWNLVVAQERINESLFLMRFPDRSSLVFFFDTQFLARICIGQIFQRAGFKFGFHKYAVRPLSQNTHSLTTKLRGFQSQTPHVVSYVTDKENASPSP